jgi:hypothetical protein
MDRMARVFRRARLFVALLALPGCGGMPIHLGTPRDGGGDARDSGCAPSQTRGAEILWIGDGWILYPGIQYTRVRDLAREAKAIGPADDFTVKAEAGKTMAEIANQYSAQATSTTKYKVLILDGGTIDTMATKGASATVTSVVNTFEQLLAQVAGGGSIQHILYFLMPELAAIPGVAALRQPMREACAQSTVPCHFLDLDPIWLGHPEYTLSASGGILPTEAGGIAMADAIWKIMRENCIAQ